jgi:hypothetical protein
MAENASIVHYTKISLQNVKIGSANCRGGSILELHRAEAIESPDRLRWALGLYLLHFHVPRSSIFKPLILSRSGPGVCGQTHLAGSYRT